MKAYDREKADTPIINARKVAVLGGGNVGQAAASVALGIGVDVIILEKNQDKIEKLKNIFPKASFVLSTPENTAKYVKEADVLIGAVCITGAKGRFYCLRT